MAVIKNLKKRPPDPGKNFNVSKIPKKNIKVPENINLTSLNSKNRKWIEAELLLSVSNRLAAHQNLDAQLQTFVEIATIELNAERGSLFLNDNQTNELYSRVAQGDLKREIRMLNNIGVAGNVFTNERGLVIHDAYGSKLFNKTIDEQTGYKTRSILCVPMKTVSGDIIGVAQVLNKKKGRFTKSDLSLLEAITTQAGIALQTTLQAESMERNRIKELEFLNVVTELSYELKLGPLLQKIMGTITKMLDAERSTLFLNDEKTGELYTEIGEGLGTTKIRFPNHVGIAGTVFTDQTSVNIPFAYADLRFNPSFDKQTGFFTRSILCTPVSNKEGKIIGVTQVLNKHGGSFTDDDESRLKAFTAQISIGLENAKLFDDVQAIKNYNESILESMSNAVVTLDEESKIVTCNASGYTIMRINPEQIIGKTAEEYFWGKNQWINETLERVREKRKHEVTLDAAVEFRGEDLSVNLTALPLQNEENDVLGTLVMMEDISSEKRVKATMARYMDPAVASQLMEAGEEVLGGQSKIATVLFSDVRGFTTLTEELGAQGTVQLLNEYFTLMVDCIETEGGMLDKFIGDAIMAIFGVPLSHEDDNDRSVRCACEMMRVLTEFNTNRKANDLTPVNIGVGINTDNVVSGNIGSPKRMDYTVIGDGVNLAARLESACKQYGAHLLVSEYTFNSLKGTFRNREVDRVIVKGKTTPVSVYEILDYHTPESFPNVVDVLEHFKNGIELYREKNFKKAKNSFSQAQRLNPEDKASAIYIERCDHLSATPPGKNWDGVWIMQNK